MRDLAWFTPHVASLMRPTSGGSQFGGRFLHNRAMPNPDIALPSRPPAEVSADDTILPFEVAPLDLRGRVVRLGPVVDAILTGHNYPEPVANLPGGGIVLGG